MGMHYEKYDVRILKLRRSELVKRRIFQLAIGLTEREP